MSLETGKYLRKEFLDDTIVPFCEDGTPYGVVYCIENMVSSKRYIGSTIDFGRRIAEYIRVYKNYSSYDESNLRPIDIALHEEGIEHFRIYPLRVCNSNLNLSYWELYYIREWETLLPNGYNDSFNTTSRITGKRIYPTGIKPNAANRKSRSRPIIAINPKAKILYVSDSLKLFGECILGLNRAIISHAASKGMKVHGYYIFYADQRSTSAAIQRKCAQYEEMLHKRSGCILDRDQEYEMYGTFVLANNLAWFRLNDYTLYQLQYTDTKRRYSIRKMT
ncbi:MAG: GIY-YIG nuclease family protein [Lachnospiraceae bacterium]|nr:GIY-YIG nuclease family protein [Lachnospiraceae bacterium]